MEGWLFGIDGGGTSSRIRVESCSGEVLYQGQGGSTNPESNDGRAVSACLEDLLRGALNPGLDPRACLAGYIGSAGVDRPESKLAMAAMLRGAFLSVAGLAEAGLSLEAGNDAEPALSGALGDVEGFLLVAGTGSIAYGRTRTGKTVRAGGWGHHLGDEGSAFWIAFEGVKRGIRSAEGREAESTLIDAAIAHFGLPDMPSMIPFVYKQFSKARIASFAPTVAAIARSGDPVARAIMDEAALELVSLVASVHARLGKEIGHGSMHKRLALHGGLLDKNVELREAVTNYLCSQVPGLEIVPALGDATEGACRLARMLLNPDRACR